ncbi:MAG: phosphopentomutase [Defluviitaleaceae bacterium]|nr:phosphopentomutase [Defluviitaleaceae bacterium]MCL2275028.1 phosphopentomutase [Defluviitaleaceae bacterium]
MRNNPRICIIVLDSVGIGALPDAAEFGDSGTHTLGNIYEKVGELKLPNLYEMGLAHIENSRLPKPSTKPTASYGRMATVTKAKDTTSGHWEIAGLTMDPPFATFEKFPESLLTTWLEKAGRPAKWLGNYPASGTQIMDELGEEHMKTGAPIVYTSADSVFQVAAHEEIIPLEELYRLCAIAREILIGDNFVGRVIARPFLGKAGAFKRTENRRDYAVPPVGETLLDALEKHGQKTLGIGKIEDIFCNRGVTYVDHTTNNADGIGATIDALRGVNAEFLDATLIFTNLVDFDMHYGHRNDPVGYARALEYFDSQLPKILSALRPGDLLIITADHGCDPTTKGTDHTREYVPLLVYSENGKALDLGTRNSLADITATIYEKLGHGKWHIGESF